ncbi:hypothetical protein SCUP515_03681 [Seiridium cupressi]
MISSHTAAAIAQTVFYVPAVPITLYVLIGNWAQGPRMAWYPLFAFALIRLVGGILVIVLGSQPTNYGLNVAAIVLLNIGLIPLIITTLFLVRFVFESSLQLKAWASIVLKALRINIFIAIGLLVAGGSLAGDSQNAVASRALGLAGYFNFLSILMALVWLLVYLYRNKNEFTIKGDYIYVQWALYSMPLLILRAVYGLLYSFTASTMDTITTTWNPLFGSAVAFALMALLPEYIVLGVYTYLGFHRKRTACRGHSKIYSAESSHLPLQASVGHK